MPGRLLFVISGILAGGIPGFCIELCCFLHPLIWPLVFLPWFSVLLLVRGHYHHDTQDVMHESPLLVAIPLLGVLLVVLFLLGLLFFLLLVFCCLLFVVFVGFACLFLWFVLCFVFSWLVVLFVAVFLFVVGSLFVCLFVGFAFLFLWFVLCFWFSCWDCILDCVQVHYQYFCGYRQLTALHDNLNSSFATIERV